MMQNKIIAVDTNLGTNFLISASDDATVSELRVLIQMEHLSCFPEHGTVKVMALTVQYGQRRYHVTNSLLLGQIFRKSWNEVHAEVSLKDASSLHGSKSAKVESLANGKAQDHCAALNDTLLFKCGGIEGLGENRQSSEALAHSSKPTLCGERFPENSNEVAPAISNSQNSWMKHEKFKCCLLSMEAPYTQSFSQINLVTRDKDIVEKGGKCRKRKCREEEVLDRKQNQVEVAGQIIVDSDRDKELSPGNRCASSIVKERKTKEAKEFLLTGHECKQDSLGRPGSRDEIALRKEDTLIVEPHKLSRKSKKQPENIVSSNTCIGDDSVPKELSKDPSSSEAVVASPKNLKVTSAVGESLYCGTEKGRSCQSNLDALKPSFSEKGLTTLEKKLVSQIPDKTRIYRDHSCPKLSSEIREEGAEEANVDTRASIGKVDLSMGYPIYLNDHSILLVASLSADVVPETQESEWQSQDGITAEGEEVALAKRGLNAYDHAVMEPHSNCPRQDLVDPQEIQARLLCQHTSNMKSTELNNDLDNLARTKETLKSKNFIAVDMPSKTVGPERINQEKSNADIEDEILVACNDKRESRLHDAGLSGTKHDGTLVRKKKKRRKRKVAEIDKFSEQEDSRFVISDSKRVYIEGDMDPKKDAEETALLTENQTNTCNHEKGRESCHMPEKQAQTELEDFDADPREMQVQNTTVVNVDERNCRESAFPGEKCREGLADSALKNERLEKCSRGGLKEGCETAQGECMKQGEVAQSRIPPKKKRKRRKEAPLPGPEGVSGDCVLNFDNEGNCVPFTIKDLPNALRLKVAKEGESNWDNKAKVVGEQVMKKKLKQKTTETDPNISLVQEQDKDNPSMNPTMTHADRNGTEPALKDGVASSFTRSPSKECSLEGMANTKQGFDVFEFDSSQTGSRPIVSGIDNNEVTSHVELNTLENLCSAAVKLVEDNILNTSKVSARKSSRKAVHPRRLITVLSERLRQNQMSKKNSRQERGNMQSKSTAKDAGLPNDKGVDLEPLFAEEVEARQASSQLDVENGRITCPVGCGRLYTKKTSAYYRHSKKCSGGNY